MPCHRLEGIRVLHGSGPVVNSNCLREIYAIVSTDRIDDAQNRRDVGASRCLARCELSRNCLNAVGRPNVRKFRKLAS